MTFARAVPLCPVRRRDQPLIRLSAVSCRVETPRSADAQMGSAGGPAGCFVRCRFPSLIGSSQRPKDSKSSRATPSVDSFRTQPVELPDIQLIRDFVIAHDLSFEEFFCTVWALVLRCYVGADAVSFGYASDQGVVACRIELAGTTNFFGLGRRCRSAAASAGGLEDLAELDTLLSAGRSALSSTIENNAVFHPHDRWSLLATDFCHISSWQSYW